MLKTFYSKRLIKVCAYLLISLVWLNSHAQTPGVIYKPAGNTLGKQVLDPNGDGYISATTAGFSGSDFGAQSELKMIAIPGMENEPSGDLNTGSSGGHTELVSSNLSPTHASYVLVRKVNNVDYLIVRVRIGGASTASKGYSLLIDTDGQFSPGGLTAVNPGFDREVVLETGNSGRVGVYTHTSSGSTRTHSYNVEEYHQRSVALSTTDGNPDYFYDFFVPFSSLGISLADVVRFTIVTITSASSGITGTISDFMGINDSRYGNNALRLMTEIISSFPAITFQDLNNSSFTFPALKTPAPVVNGGITTSSTSISGTSTEANGTTITVYKNGSSIGTTTVSNNGWTLSSVSGLAAGNNITAKAQATAKPLSDASNVVIVTSPQTCYLPVPAITSFDNGQTRVNGTWGNGQTITSNSVEIRVFVQNTSTNPHGFTRILPKNPNTNTPVYVATNGNWVFDTDFNQTNFAAQTYYVQAYTNTCNSDYSSPGLPSSGGSGTVSANPEILTTQVTTSSNTITVKNNHTASATLYLYVNGVLKLTASGIAAGTNNNFSVSGLLLENDVVSARAIGALTTDRLSGLSNTITVTTSSSTAPVITGSYSAGSGKIVTGTSVEAAGAEIILRSNGTQIGTATTVTAFNNWSISGLTLTSGHVLTATAKATGKAISGNSNSVTVASSAPASPTVTGAYEAGATSVSGTGGIGTVRLYVDGAEIGSATATGSWTISNLSPTELYRGAVITARNDNGALSAASNAVTVTGVVSFEIKASNGNAVPTTFISGDPTPIRISAKNGNAGGGNVVTGFNKNVVVSASSRVLKGEGSTSNLGSGSLGSDGSFEIALGGSGSVKISVVNPEDPTAIGEVTVNVVHALWRGKNTGTTMEQKGHAQNTNWTHGRVPLSGADVKYADDVLEDMELQGSTRWGNVDFNGKGKHLILNNYNLTVGSVSNVGSSIFKTTGTGKLRMGAVANQEQIFRVGNSTYNPLKITNKNETDTFSVRVVDAVYQNGVSGSESTAPHVRRTWDITKETASNTAGVDFVFEWQANEELSSVATPALFHFENNNWVKYTPVTNNQPSIIGSTKTWTFTGYTGTFSPFAIGDGTATLPVQYRSISSVCEQSAPAFYWETATETNNAGFYIDGSNDQSSWSALTWIKGAGNSNIPLKYAYRVQSLTDASFKFFRLRQVDHDGKVSHSTILRNYCNAPKQALLVFPNPVTGSQLQVQLSKAGMVEMYDQQGKQVMRNQMNAGIHSIDIQGLSKGIYLLRTVDANTRFIRQ